MATYYTSSNNQRDTAPMLYLREPLPSSYPEASVLPNNMMIYMNSGSYSDGLNGNSQQQNNCMEMPTMGASDSSPQQQGILSNLGGSRIEQHDFTEWRDGRNELVVPHGVSGAPSILHGGPNLQGQGLSLSLGTQIPSGIQMPSISYRNPNMGFASFLSPNPSISGEGGCRNGSSRNEQSRNVEYFTPGFPGGNQDSNKGDLSSYGMSSVARTIPNSKYLKALQQLLDEVVNVRKALKQHDSENRTKGSKEGDDGSKNESTLPSGSAVSSNPQESASTSPCELSHAEKQDLQNKLTKLLSMLDEVWQMILALSTLSEVLLCYVLFIHHLKYELIVFKGCRTCFSLVSVTSSN